MDKEKTSKLFNDFPNLYRGRTEPLTQNLMGFGFSCGDGWFNLIYELSEKVSKLDPECVAVQVKEKFGGLRFYTGPTLKEVHDLISEYEKKSFKTCEDCGTTKTVKRRDGGWIRTQCNKCYKEDQDYKKEQMKKYELEEKQKNDKPTT
jgi:ribosomal protein L37AE/L43A